MSVPRLLCDTNVVVSGLIWDGALRRVLTRIQAGAALGYTCIELLEELRYVLLYRKIARVLEHAELTPDDILTWLAAHFTIVACSPLPSAVITADPSDDMVLACAHAAHAAPCAACSRASRRGLAVPLRGTDAPTGRLQPRSARRTRRSCAAYTPACLFCTLSTNASCATIMV